MYIELMNAKEALIKTYENRVNQSEENFNKVARLINDAIDRGDTYIRCSYDELKDMTSETEKRLRKMGYRIYSDRSLHSRINYFIIAWDNEDRENEDHSIRELFKDINTEE